MKRLMISVIVLLGLMIITQVPGRAQVFFTASLDGSQTVPAAATNGTGTAWAELNEATQSLTYRITYANLDSTFTHAHFHLGAAGTNGPVVFPLDTSFSGNTAEGTWSNIPDSLIAALLKGEIYVNIHSLKYPAGEIRGQLETAPGAGISISLDGSQDVPALSVPGTGTGWAIFKPDSNVLLYRITVTGLTSDVSGAHFHYGTAGTNGPVVFPISVNDSTADGEWSFPDTMWTHLVNNDLYANVHTSNNPSGEIRGQFTLQPSSLEYGSSVFLTATLNAGNTVPPATSNGSGTGWAVLTLKAGGVSATPSLRTPYLTYRITYNDLDSTFTAAHFHLASAGANGPVVMPISTFSGNTAQGTWTGIPDTLVNDILSGNIYVNVHSKAYPGGEIRGQLERADGVPFSMSLSSGQSVPSLSTTGTGTGWAVLDTSGSNLNYNITVAGLSSSLTAAHFHLGATGSNGPVVEPLTYRDSTASGIWAGVPDTLLPDLLSGMIYANFHTSDHPSGEIRGQLLANSGALLTAVKEVRNNSPQRYGLLQNYPNPFNPTTVIGYTLPVKAQVRLEVYNILGQRIATLIDGVESAGTHFVNFNGEKLASGVYFYMLSAGGNTILTRKMILLK